LEGETPLLWAGVDRIGKNDCFENTGFRGKTCAPEESGKDETIPA